MFRAAHRSSSGVLNCICSLWFICPYGDRPLPSLSGHWVPLKNFGIINSITKLHLVGIYTDWKKLLRKLCILSASLTYVYHEARVRKCKVYLIFCRLFSALCPCFPQKSEKKIISALLRVFHGFVIPYKTGTVMETTLLQQKSVLLNFTQLSLFIVIEAGMW
jgi:hypothetical protein